MFVGQVGRAGENQKNPPADDHGADAAVSHQTALTLRPGVVTARQAAQGMQAGGSKIPVQDADGTVRQGKHVHRIKPLGGDGAHFGQHLQLQPGQVRIGSGAPGAALGGGAAPGREADRLGRGGAARQQKAGGEKGGQAVCSFHKKGLLLPEKQMLPAYFQAPV